MASRCIRADAGLQQKIPLGALVLGLGRRPVNRSKQFASLLWLVAPEAREARGGASILLLFLRSALAPMASSVATVRSCISPLANPVSPKPWETSRRLPEVPSQLFLLTEKRRYVRGRAKL
jgi:hypothetical protein